MCGKMAELLKEGEEKGLHEGRREGRKEGRREGRIEERRSTVARLLDLGKFSLEDIAAGAGLSLDEVRALAEQRRGA